MTFDFAEMWAHMPLLGKLIALSLAAMMVSFVGVTLERVIAFARSAKESRSFAARAGELLEEWRLEELVTLASQHPSSTLAKVVGPIVGRYVRACQDGGAEGLSPAELARSEGERRQEAVGEDLRRGMNVIATVGSLAPFVGLLGTVVGIIGAFQGIGAAGSAGIAPVMRGISEALIETAFGLLVAIPAVIAFNYLNARISAIETALGRSSSELLEQLEQHRDRSSSRRATRAA